MNIISAIDNFTKSIFTQSSDPFPNSSENLPNSSDKVSETVSENPIEGTTKHSGNFLPNSSELFKQKIDYRCRPR